MHKILVTTSVDPMTSAHSRLHELIAHLTKKHEVTVVSVRDSWKRSQDSSNVHTREHKELASSMNLIYLTDTSRNIVTQELTSPAILSRKIPERDRNSYSAIIDYNTICLGLSASLIIRGIPRVYDIADDLSDMVRNSPHLPRVLGPLASAIARHIIIKSMRDATVVTGTSAELMREYRVPSTKSVVVPNGVPSHFLDRPLSTDSAERESRPDDFTICYVGVLREWVDFKPVLMAMHDVRDEVPAKLLILGGEGGISSINSLCSEMGMRDSVKIIGTVPHEMVPSYVAACNCGIIPFDASKTSDFALPLKLLEYLSIGVPVVSSRIRTVVREFPNEVFFYTDQNDLAELIRLIRIHPEISMEKTSAGRLKVEKEYTWDRVLAKYDSLLESLIG